MDNKCDLILGSFYTKELVDELQLSMCIFLNLNKQKAIGLFITDSEGQSENLLVSYVQEVKSNVPVLIIDEGLILKYFDAKKDQFYRWRGTVATIRSMMKLLDFYCESELGQKPIDPIGKHPFLIELMRMLGEVEKRNLQIESKLKK